MKLNKALKLKNKLVTDINHLKSILSRENSRRDDSTSTVDRNQVWRDIVDKTIQLVNLKTEIAKANKGIWDKIFQIAEHKAGIAYLQSLNTNNEVHREYIGGELYKEVKYNAQIKAVDVDNSVMGLQNTIQALQDEVDLYNATTEIENFAG